MVLKAVYNYLPTSDVRGWIPLSKDGRPSDGWHIPRSAQQPAEDAPPAASLTAPLLTFDKNNIENIDHDREGEMRGEARQASKRRLEAWQVALLRCCRVISSKLAEYFQACRSAGRGAGGGADQIEN